LNKKIVAIHQPDFMPWVGFFLKVYRSDVFVVLDHVTNRPGGRSWFRRVSMSEGGSKTAWVSIPLVHPKGVQFVPINEMEINVGEGRLMKKYTRMVQQSYSKCPYFTTYYPLFEEYFTFATGTAGLAERNMRFIRAVFDLISIQPEIYFSSAMDCEKKAAELMVEIVQKTSGTCYLSGDGGSDYQDVALFEENGIELIYNSFKPVEYPQINEKSFLPGLSILDVLMNIGSDGVTTMLENYGKMK